MRRFFIGIMSIIALVSVAKITPAQQREKAPSQQSVNAENIAENSPYQVGTITGIVSGEYGSILFIELDDKTKVRFHHPSNSLSRGEQVLVYQKNGNHFIIQASDPQR
jgi:hypothetical protein